MSARTPILALLAAVLAIIMAACASIGRPEGGPRDYNPPQFVRSSPMPGATNARPGRMEIYFDENVELEDAFNKVIVSPAGNSTPVVRSLGHRVTVEFRDTLQENTTYTIDFGDAIKDLNEGNIIDGFALDFSTGAEIDTLRISGMLFEARTLEPAQGMTVAVTTNLSDTAFTKVPMERVARTNQYGQFTVRNLKPGTYRVYAINDVNRDRLWDRTEDIAFYDVTVTPTSERVNVSDTLRSSEGTDSIVSREATHFMPDDIIMTWFNEDYRTQYLKDHDRPDRRRITLGMAAPSDSLPRLTVARGPLAGRPLDSLALLAASATRDTLTYWITDPGLLAQDSISLSVRYLATDTASQLSWKTDTIAFNYKAPKPKKKDKKDKDENAHTDSVPTIQPIDIQTLTATNQELSRPLVFRFPEPIASLDSTMWTFEKLVDTTWTAEKMPPIIKVPTAPLTDRRIDYDWEPGAKYRLHADSAAVMSVYGTPSSTYEVELNVKKLEEYANLMFTVNSDDTTAMVVELLDGQDNPVRTAAVDRDHRAMFPLVIPNVYYARVFFDRNGDGAWTTGDVAESLQPEDVAYYPKKITLRANWDNELSWNPYEIPLDQQKPSDIKKNKPKLKKNEQQQTNPEDEEDVDEWGNPVNGSGGGNRNNFGGFGPGSLQQSSGTSATPRPTRR